EVGGLFYALPPGEVPAASSVIGSWNCEDAGFWLDLSVKGDRVAARVNGLPPGSGTLRDGLAQFTIRDGTNKHSATATVRNGKLDLKWESLREGPGEATCKPVTSTENWSNSRALVLLYYYDGMYTTHSKPGSAPVARVWKNPLET